MALALVQSREVRRIINLYEDVICLLYLESSGNYLNEVITKRIEEIIGNAYQLTDSLIKLIKVEVGDENNVETKRLLNSVRIVHDDCPVVCYFKNRKLVGKHTKTFTQHLLEAWIDQFFYLEK